MIKESIIFLHRDGEIELPNVEYCRTFEEFTAKIVEYLETFECYPSLIIFSNSLDDQQQWWFEAKKNKGKIPVYEKFKNKSGMHCLSWLMELSDMMVLYPNRVQIADSSWANNLLLQVYNKWREESGLDITPMTTSYLEIQLPLEPVKSLDDILDRNNDLSTILPKENISKGGIILSSN